MNDNQTKLLRKTKRNLENDSRSALAYQSCLISDVVLTERLASFNDLSQVEE